MTTLATVRRDTALAVAHRLEAVGVGETATGLQVFGPGDVALIPNGVTPAAPDRTITINPYLVIPPAARMNAARVRVQCRIRGVRSDVDSSVTLAGLVLQALHLEHATQWGGLWVQRCEYIGGSWLGVDQNDRHEEAHNFEVLVQVSPGDSVGESGSEG